MHAQNTHPPRGRPLARCRAEDASSIYFIQDTEGDENYHLYLARVPLAGSSAQVRLVGGWDGNSTVARHAPAGSPDHLHLPQASYRCLTATANRPP